MKRSQRERVNVKGRSVATEKGTRLYPTSEEERARQGIYLDRYQKRLNLADRVKILTLGGHTDRSRHGVISGFDDHRNRVFILDEAGVTQERAPKNLKLLQ